MADQRPQPPLQEKLVSQLEEKQGERGNLFDGAVVVDLGGMPLYPTPRSIPNVSSPDDEPN